MAVHELIHWHEGMFLQPHHMQALQRQFLELFSAERRLAWSYPYGVVESRISADQLENMVVGFDRLRLVMPSGIIIDYPGNAELPRLDIKHAMAAASGSLVISIGLPRWSADRANTITGNGDARERRVFRVEEVERPDENTGLNPQPVQMRRINARLLLPDDDDSDLEVMPLLRLLYSTGEDVSLPRQDPNFIPPCLVLSGSPTLRELVRDLANQVEASRVEQRLKLTSAGFSLDTMRGVQFSQMLRLRTLGRFGARLSSQWQAPGTTPFDMYIELRELLAELAALQPDRDQYEVAKYDHDNPAIAFQELSRKIRPLLKPEGTTAWGKVKFTRDGRVLAAALTQEQLTMPNAYFLGIKTKLDPREITRLVENKDQFKLMPHSLTGKKVFGIQLVEDRNRPLELPAEVGLNYFRLDRDRSKKIWELVEHEKRMSLEWPNLEAADFVDHVTLYYTIPAVGERK